MSECACFADLAVAATKLRHWLFDAALPLWTDVGVDSAAGSFVEAIGLVDGAPSRAAHRCFVQSRQVYSLIEAGRLGWTGDWKGLAGRALDWHLASFRLADGTFAHGANASGSITDHRFDLYDQAFVLFGLAHAGHAIPERRAECVSIADELLSGLELYYRHPVMGFEETSPPTAPLRANPHMHLLEAALAWEEADGGECWSKLADDIMELALARLIDASSGCIHEFFNREWAPLMDDQGRQIEPGHHFEWAWLAQRWGRKRARPDALRAAHRLFEIGMQHGLCPHRNMVVLELNDDYSPRVPIARLWGQTEWLKAALIFAAHAKGETRIVYLESALSALRAMEQFIVSAPSGLWRDKVGQNGVFVDEPAPASSLYHIVCAVAELVRFCALPIR